MNNLKGKNLCNPHGFMRHKKTPTNTVTHPGIMALKPGVAWMGCTDTACKNEVVIKKCYPHEFHVQKVMHNEFPDIVPKVYDGVECFDGFYMYSAYAKEGTLKKNKNSTKIDSLVYKTLLALKRIHDKYPSFRHNDLHVDNVLVKNNGVLIYDFGLANWHGNPIFDSKLKTDYGIYPGNHPMYDFHFFVVSIFSDLPARFKTKAQSVFPEEYLKKDSPVVKEYRLRSDVNHTGLPTMDQVIQAFSVGNNKMRVIPLPGETSRKFVKKSPVPVPTPAKKPIRFLTFPAAEKKRASPKKASPKRPSVKFTLANKRKMSNRKANIISMERNRLTRSGMSNNNINQAIKNFNVRAELQAIKNIENLKLAGLLSPSPSPVKKPSKARGFVPASAAGPSRPAPVLVFSPGGRARINKKLCSSYKKDELLDIMRRLGHRVNKSMTLKELCGKLKPVASLKPVTRAESVSVYKRPAGNSIVNVRKQTYPKLLRGNLYKLGKAVGVPVISKNKKGNIVNKIYAKLNKNYANIMKTSNKTKITTRQVAEILAHSYGWKNNRHVERLRLVKTFPK